MDVAGVGEHETGEAVQVLIRRCAYHEAAQEAARSLGIDVGRFCQAMLGEDGNAHRVVQEVFVCLFDAMPTLETVPLRPWLFGCAYRLCVEQLAATDAQQRADALALTRDDDRRLPPEAEAERVRSRRTRAGLEKVPPRSRGAALLRYCAHLGYADVAKICGMSEQDAVKQTGRALLGLRNAVAAGGPSDGEGGA